MQADPITHQQVLEVLKTMVACIHAGDIDGALGLFATDPDVFLQGTGTDEARTGRSEIREQVARDLSQADAVSWKMYPPSISAAGPVAWTAGDVLISVSMNGRTMEIPHRLTLVLERRDDRWLILQMHLSVANGAQAVGQSFPTAIEAVADAASREHVDLRARTAPDGTVTLLFSDIEGSTSLAERLGDVRWLALLREHNALVRREIARYGGFEVKTIGDAFMIAFGSARRGVLCAVGMQRAFARFAEENPEHPIRVRIGLHAGEPLGEGGDFYGKSVAYASRVATEAAGGEVLVSALMHALTESAGDIRFGPGRDVNLDGIAGTQRLYPILFEPEGEAGPASTDRLSTLA